jgi:hypothetical protein
MSLWLLAKPDTYHIDTSNVLFILSGAFVGLDSIVKRRVAKGVRQSSYITFASCVILICITTDSRLGLRRTYLSPRTIIRMGSCHFLHLIGGRRRTYLISSSQRVCEHDF